MPCRATADEANSVHDRKPLVLPASVCCVLASDHTGIYQMGYAKVE